MLRRLIKEELYRMDGTPLFPERRASTAGYALSPEEVVLYQAVTTYVRDEMNRADRSGDGNRRTSVGFALQILQRRLASSPAAIHRSLERRRKRLEERLREERDPRGALDEYGLLKTMIDNWRDAFDESFSRTEKHRVRNFVSTALEARNATSHLSIPLRDNEALRRYLD